MFGGDARRTLARPAVELGLPKRKPLWARGLGEYIEYPPSYCDGVLYVNTFKGDTWAIDAETGKVIWKKVSNAPKPSTPAIAGDNLIVSSKDGTVTALTRRERQARVAAADERDRGVVARGGGGRRVLRRNRRAPLRRRRRHRPRPLGVRHRRPDQLEPLARAGARVRHDLRGLDLLRPPARRPQALEHVREARRVPLRELLRERLHGRRAPLHDGALGEGHRARRVVGPRAVDGRGQLARLLDAGRRERPDLRRRLQRGPPRLCEDERPAHLAGARRRADPRRAGGRRRPRLLLDARDGDVRRARLGREGRLALRARQVLAGDRDGADVLLLAQRHARRLPRPRRAVSHSPSGIPQERNPAARSPACGGAHP